MDEMLQCRADEIIKLLCELPEVKGCGLYGSLANGTADALSDIDIDVDVSGSDNGIFMLSLSQRLSQKITVYYSDYAPSLVPEKYIVSIGIDENHPTCVVDLCCTANPHCTTVTKQLVREKNDSFSHILKLWTANWKHYVRGTECKTDILRMVGKIDLPEPHTKSESQLLEETLQWLESNAPDHLKQFILSCRREYKSTAASI